MHPTPLQHWILSAFEASLHPSLLVSFPQIRYFVTFPVWHHELQCHLLHLVQPSLIALGMAESKGAEVGRGTAWNISVEWSWTQDMLTACVRQPSH